MHVARASWKRIDDVSSSPTLSLYYLKKEKKELVDFSRTSKSKGQKEVLGVEISESVL